MIPLCKHLTDWGQCGVKACSDDGDLSCPAVETFCHSIRNINYALMQEMACSDKWEDARKEDLRKLLEVEGQ